MQEGTGIGLALVKELVSLQGGKITVCSEENEGACFKILLPILQVNETIKPQKDYLSELKKMSVAAISKEKVADSHPPLLQPTDKLDLLIIEDNREMSAYIRSCLDATQYQITEAANGQEGIEVAQNLIPDLIISDIMMPQKSGYEVVETLRGNIATSHIPIILLSAKSSLESRLKGLKKGADAYLTKPFSPEELNMRIQKLIEIRQLLQQRYRGNLPLLEEEEHEQEDEFITKLRTFILENLEEPDLNGTVVGKHIGMSRPHLYRKLKALTGQPISVFVKEIRLLKAMELLEKGKLNISEITYQTGFASLSSFSRSFKERFGESPSKYETK